LRLHDSWLSILEPRIRRGTRCGHPSHHGISCLIFEAGRSQASQTGAL